MPALGYDLHKPFANKHVDRTANGLLVGAEPTAQLFLGDLTHRGLRACRRAGHGLRAQLEQHEGGRAPEDRDPFTEEVEGCNRECLADEPFRLRPKLRRDRRLSGLLVRHRGRLRQPLGRWALA